MVWKGLTEPPAPPVFVKEPVTNGTSWPTFRVASSLSVVTIDGVEIILVSASPSRARKIAAKLTLESEIRPTPRVIPSPTTPDGSEPLPTVVPSWTTPLRKSGKLVIAIGELEPLASTPHETPSSFF